MKSILEEVRVGGRISAWPLAIKAIAENPLKKGKTIKPELQDRFDLAVHKYNQTGIIISPWDELYEEGELIEDL